jgi:hypothetical protein
MFNPVEKILGKLKKDMNSENLDKGYFISKSVTLEEAMKKDGLDVNTGKPIKKKKR